MLELRALLGQELVRDLDQDAGAVAGDRIGADGAAVLEVLEDVERVLDDAGAICAPLRSAMKPTPQASYSRRGIEQAACLGKELDFVLRRIQVPRTAGRVHRCRHGLEPSGLKRVAVPCE